MDQERAKRNGIKPGTPAWELAMLIGRYEESTKTVFNRLEKIEETNGKILKAIGEQKNVCTETRQRFDVLATNELKYRDEKYEEIDGRLETLEEKGETELSRNSKLQIVANFIVSVINIVATAFTRFIGG